jgi:L-lactate utilization protein LutC
MADKQDFLKMVRTSLGVSERRDIARDDSTGYFLTKDEVSQAADDIRADAAQRRSELVDGFVHRATEAGWKIHRVANYEDAAEEVTAVVREHGAKAVMRSDHDILSEVPLESALKAEGIELEVAMREPSDDADEDLERRLALRETSFNSEVGITGVDFAIAETGTVAMKPGIGSSRLVSLTPEVHIGVMTPESIIPSLDELFALTRDQHLSGEHKGMINLITGPSRTADIEANLVIGVHGPREVHLVIVG